MKSTDVILQHYDTNEQVQRDPALIEDFTPFIPPALHRFYRDVASDPVLNKVLTPYHFYQLTCLFAMGLIDKADHEQNDF